MTVFGDVESLMEGWDTLFQGITPTSMTTETFANLCPLLWAEFSPVTGAATPSREILFSVLPNDVEEDFFHTSQTLNDTERSRRFVSVGYPDWMVVVETIPAGYPVRLVGGVINTAVLEQDSTIAPEIKNFALSPNVRDHDVLLWLLIQAYRFRTEGLEQARTHIAHLVNERAALKESHAEAVAGNRGA